jgi:hypothetical protein
MRANAGWGHRTHQQAPGEAVTCFTYTDSFRSDMIADPLEAYEDCVAAHRWATRELDGASEPMRRFNLISERKRLADIAWKLKRWARVK